MKFRRTQEEDYSLQLAPLIDVVFLLLIFFMVSTAFIDFTRRMDIELPETDAGVAAQAEKVYEIEITVDKEIFLNGESITSGNLRKLLDKKDPAFKKRSAVIRADRKLEYGYVVKIMGICKTAGIFDIAITVQ